MTIRRSYVDGHFGQIHLRTAASLARGKPALLCLHQSPKAGLEFEKMMLASDGRLIVAPDYPGYGLSDPPPSESEATIETYAAEMWRVADALGLEIVDLFGNHTGSKVAARMAMKRPDRVRAIVMVSAALLTEAERKAFIDYFTPIPLDRKGTRFWISWQRIVEHSDPALPLEDLARSFMQNLLGGEGYEWGHAAAFADGTAFETALRTLPHPIAIINPADQLQEITRRAAPMMKRGRIVERPDWRHGFLDLHAKAVADLVFGFVDAPP
ncbi:MAG: alpha/beta fold hydrolase [Parvularculaceae bacterium]